MIDVQAKGVFWAAAALGEGHGAMRTEAIAGFERDGFDALLLHEHLDEFVIGHGPKHVIVEALAFAHDLGLFQFAA